MPAGVAAEARSFVATPDRISEPDDWIDHTGAAWRVPEQVIFRARVCVAELAANLMEHGQARAEGEPMSIALQADGAALEIEVTDRGHAFDPTAPEPPTSHEESCGGRGLLLLRAYATAMNYRRDGGQNILRLRIAPG